MTIRAVTAALLALAAPAAAHADSLCRGDVRNVDRELTLRGQQLSPMDRAVAEQRLSRTEGLCDRDAPRAQQDLEQIRRDIIQQATRPGELPGLPHTGLDRR